MKINILNKFILIFSFFYCLIPFYSFLCTEENEKKTEKKNDRKNLLEVSFGNNSKFTTNIKNRTETFYGKSTRLLSGSALDQVVYPQTTWDLTSYTEIEKIVKSQV